MPIYKLSNSSEQGKKTVGDHSEIEYINDDFNLARISYCVHLGYGDIKVYQASARNSYPDEIVFVQTDDPQPIGNKSAIDPTDDLQSCAPVRLIFDDPQSVDVLIEQLQQMQIGLKQGRAQAAEETVKLGKLLNRQKELYQFYSESTINEAISLEPEIVSLLEKFRIKEIDLDRLFGGHYGYRAKMHRLLPDSIDDCDASLPSISRLNA